MTLREFQSLGPSDAAHDPAVALVAGLLGAGRAVRLVVRGWSMWPALRDGDAVVLEPARADDLRVGDIAAFRPSEGSGIDALVVHRFLGRRGGRLLFRGDSAPLADAPAPSEAVVGRVAVRERAGRATPLGRGWRRRCGRWVLALGPLSRAALAVRRRLLRLVRGGPPLSLGPSAQRRADRAMLAWALGERPAYPAYALLASPRYAELLPLIAWVERQAPASLPEPAARALGEAEDRALYDSAQAEDLLRHLARRAAQAGIALLVVKGPALGHGGVYPAPHTRPAADVDLVCPPAGRARVVRLLLDDGFANAEPEYPISYYLRYRSEVALFHPGRVHWPRVEVHWTGAGGLYFGGRLPARRLFAASRSSPWGPGLRVLAPEMEAAHAVAHLAKHVRAPRPLWALDLALLTRGGLDWERVGGLLREARLHRVAPPLLVWVADRAVGTVPSALAGGPAGRPRLSWTEARMLYGGASGIGRWIEALSLPTWGQRLGYLAETIIPRRAVMERLYPRAHGRSLVPYHLRRWLRLAGRALGIGREPYRYRGSFSGSNGSGSSCG